MSNLSKTCNGCGRSFKRDSDRTQHLIKTKDSRCQKAAEELVAQLRRSRFGPRIGLSSYTRHKVQSNSRSAQPTTPSLSPLPQESREDSPTPFVGDFFGMDYTSADFPGFDEERLSDDESLSDDSNDEGEDLVESQWEPDRQAQKAAEHIDMDTDAVAPSSFRQDNPLLRHLPAHRQGIHVQTFGGRAGAPMPESQPQTFHRAEDGFGLYQSLISGSEENIWAPFASKVDWEVARWAKMRGSGSTAFSELLAITGVSQFSLTLSFFLLIIFFRLENL